MARILPVFGEKNYVNMTILASPKTCFPDWLKTEKNMVSYKFEGQEDDGVLENLIHDALVKL